MKKKDINTIITFLRSREYNMDICFNLKNKKELVDFIYKYVFKNK